jgi:UDP-N-acetyl-D-mannosaminuronic acid dehydrogenase
MELYSSIVKGELIPTDVMTAEVAKVVENTYRDVNIAFANEVALICESLGINAYEVRKLVNSLPNDPSNPATNPYRNMHFPGAGVGGHCLPKDPWLLKYGVDAYGKKKVPLKLIENSRKVNDQMPYHMANLIENAFKENGLSLNNSKVVILGIAFLPNSDDVRNTPSLPLYNQLREMGAEVIVHDPYVKEYEGVKMVKNLDDALRNADCLVIMTAHEKYRDLDLDEAGEIMRNRMIVDGRNFFEREFVEKKGFAYYGLGKGK